MKVTVQMEINLDELIEELNDCAMNGDDISRMSKFKLLYLLKHYNSVREETSPFDDDDDDDDEGEILEPLPKKKTTPCSSCSYRDDETRSNCKECRKNDYCHYEVSV